MNGGIIITISVKDILFLKPFEKAVIVAGKKGLDRGINGVSLIEVPEAKDMFREKELYITAFYSIKENIRMQIATLEKIKYCNAAGICYIDMYIKDLDQRVLGYADRNDIPIIKIPFKVHYSTMISSIMRAIIHKKDRELMYSQQIKSKILQLFKTKSIDQIVNILEELSANPILYLSNEKTYLSNLAKSIPTEILNQIINITKVNRVTNRVKHYQFDIYRMNKDGNEEKIVIIYLHNDNIANLRTIDFVMELGQWIITYQNYNDKLLKTKRERLLNEIFSAIIEKETPPKLLLEKINQINWKMSSNYLTAVLYINSNSSLEYKVFKYQNVINSLFNEKGITIRKKNSLVIFISTDHKIQEIKNIFLNKIDNINIYSNNYTKSTSDNILLLGLGRLKNDILKLKESYREAQRALDFGLRLTLNNTLCYWEDVCLFDLLTTSGNRDIITMFIQNTLGDLVKKEFIVYRNTLYVYFCFNEDRQKTSEILNIHYNTVKYRIAKAADILKGQLSNNKYLVYLALKIYQMLN